MIKVLHPLLSSAIIWFFLWRVSYFFWFSFVTCWWRKTFIFTNLKMNQTFLHFWYRFLQQLLYTLELRDSTIFSEVYKFECDKQVWQCHIKHKIVDSQEMTKCGANLLTFFFSSTVHNNNAKNILIYVSQMLIKNKNTVTLGIIHHFSFYCDCCVQQNKSEQPRIVQKKIQYEFDERETCHDDVLDKNMEM